MLFDVHLPMHYSEISSLTDDEALSLAQQHSDFASLVGNKPVLSHQLTINTESFKVDLHLTVDDDKKKKKKKKTAVMDSGAVS